MFLGRYTCPSPFVGPAVFPLPLSILSLVGHLCRRARAFLVYIRMIDLWVLVKFSKIHEHHSQGHIKETISLPGLEIAGAGNSWVRPGSPRKRTWGGSWGDYLRKNGLKVKNSGFGSKGAQVRIQPSCCKGRSTLSMCVHLFNRISLISYHVPGTVWGSGMFQTKILAFRELIFWLRRQA